MNQFVHIQYYLLRFGLPLALLVVLAVLMTSSVVGENDLMSQAITVDLLLTVPLVYYLLIRKTSIPKTTVVPVILVGVALGSYLLPQEDQTLLSLFKTWALPLIELVILAYIIVKIRKAIKAYKALDHGHPDFFSKLKATCREILPQRLVMPFAIELAVFYYGFISWSPRRLKSYEFSYHRRSGTPALMGAFIFIIGIETFVFHLLLAQWSSIAAWVFTLLSVYTGLQIYGFARSLSKRPIAIFADRLSLKYGIMNEVDIELSAINNFEFSSRKLRKDKTTATLSPLGEMEKHNVIIHLEENHTMTGLYGWKKNFKTIAFHVDDVEAFKAAMNHALDDIA